MLAFLTLFAHAGDVLVVGCRVSGIDHGAFAVLGISGVLALILYWIFSIYWYDTVFQFGILLYIAFLFWGCSVRWQMTRSSGWNRPFTKECLWKTV